MDMVLNGIKFFISFSLEIQNKRTSVADTYFIVVCDKAEPT